MAKKKTAKSKPAAKKTAKPAVKAKLKAVKGKVKPKGKTAAKAATSVAKQGAGADATLMARDRALDAISFAASMVSEMSKDWPADKLCAQPTGTDNHLLWTHGHLATSYAWFAEQVGAKVTLPESYNTLFGYGSKPTGDPAAYPPISEVRQHQGAALNALLQAAKKLSAGELTGAPSEKPSTFAKDRLAYLERCAWHDGWHTGQLSALRRSLGLPGVM